MGSPPNLAMFALTLDFVSSVIDGFPARKIYDSPFQTESLIRNTYVPELSILDNFSRQESESSESGFELVSAESPARR